jgi:hypothetical protein
MSSQGYYRRKTRSQAQQELTFQQNRFDGGLDLDAPATKIRSNEAAVLTNLVAYRDYVEGHAGRKYYCGTRPGSGRVWDELQHPVTKRVLMHRGSGLWLSTDSTMTSWDEITVIGPDGSLTASGTFTDGRGAITGGAATFLSDMVLAGVTPGQVFTVDIVDAGGGYFAVEVSSGATLVARGTTTYGTLTALPLAEESGSGINGTVDTDTILIGNVPVSGTFTAATYSVSFDLRGLTLENTDNYELWWKVVVAGANATVTLYKDAAMTQSVGASAAFDKTTGDSQTISPLNDSGLSGIHTWTSSTYPNGTYTGSSLEFTVVAEDIDEPSKIESYLDTGFLVYVRGAAPHNIYVEQEILKYWFLSTVEGYGAAPINPPASTEAFQYRYIYTLSRIVDPITKEPEYGGTRVSAQLQFEGPSNKVIDVDYMTGFSTAAIASGSPLVFDLREGGLDELIGLDAAAYITHISIYRTIEVNENPGAAEQYIWVADVPIYSTSYSDATDDATLVNRAVAAYGLKTRFWDCMAKGIGAVGPNFLYTAAPDTVKVTYTDIATNPQFIGYHNPAIQFMNVRSPIVQILRPRDIFVILSKSYTMYSADGINENGGNPLAGEYTPVIKHLQPSSESLGLNSPMSFTFLNETDFAGNCADGTVRIFRGDKWGNPLDSDLVHTLIGRAADDMTLGFMRDALYPFFRVDPEETVQDYCMRFGLKSYAGYQWSRIARDSWLFPTVGLRPLRLVDADGVDRLLILDDDGLTYSIEDENDQRQWVDDVGDSAVIVGEASDRFSNFIISGYSGDNLYGYYQAGLAYTWVLFSDIAMTDEVGRFNLDPVAGTYNLVPAVGYPGVSASVEFNGDIDWPDGNLDVELSGTSQVEYPTEFRARELTGSQENMTCYHNESHIYLRDIPNHTKPDDFSLTIRGYANGAAVAGAVVTGAPYDGDLQFRAVVGGNRIQVGFETNSARFRIAGLDTEYQSRDMVSATGPSDTPEYAYQRELATGMQQWLTRPYTAINSANGADYVASGGTPERVEDPTLAAYGLRFTTEIAYSQAAQPDLSGDFTIMGWWTPEDTLATLVNVGGATVGAAGNALVTPAGTNYLSVFTGGWKHVAIVRASGMLSAYVDGVLAGAPVADATDYNSGTVSIGDSDFTIFDMRVYGKALAAAVINYYVDDIQLNRGRKVLSVF